MSVVVIVIDHEEKVMTKISELAETLNAVDAKINKIGTETTTLIETVKALQEQLQNVELPAEAQTALDAVVASAQKVDDLVQD